jgi:hypothetical protein
VVCPLLPYKIVTRDEVAIPVPLEIVRSLDKTENLVPLEVDAMVLNQT